LRIQVGYEEGLWLSGVGLSSSYRAQVRLPSYKGGYLDVPNAHRLFLNSIKLWLHEKFQAMGGT
jgi:hypothetical protein